VPYIAVEGFKALFSGSDVAVDGGEVYQSLYIYAENPKKVRVALRFWWNADKYERCRYEFRAFVFSDEPFYYEVRDTWKKTRVKIKEIDACGDFNPNALKRAKMLSFEEIFNTFVLGNASVHENCQEINLDGEWNWRWD